ncbi:hypothetical protein [Candidatus Nitrosotenuis sp. DW1]|uniref:hypothetical protein n=1 Tax=Candidatus Nitrosotenuis sp. DW1 TaxID=2259672 RepID=UPI0015CDED14|nr:hypothetical protein [Candidatus Nitrosotenuis sp. DW1]QLH08814.1 hypothetical protein DSQ19_04340 [Candidatus Nitrosotenuis sp. DW1]
MSNEDLKQKLLAQIEALKLFPNNIQVKILRSRINKQLEQISKQTEIKETIPVDKKQQANLSRSIKLKKHFRYLRLIRDNYPNLKFAEIRKQFSKRKRGEDVSIPDATWFNPSP